MAQDDHGTLAPEPEDDPVSDAWQATALQAEQAAVARQDQDTVAWYQQVLVTLLPEEMDAEAARLVEAWETGTLTLDVLHERLQLLVRRHYRLTAHATDMTHQPVTQETRAFDSLAHVRYILQRSWRHPSQPGEQRSSQPPQPQPGEDEEQ
jgi:hypothetical protein